MRQSKNNRKLIIFLVLLLISLGIYFGSSLQNYTDNKMDDWAGSWQFYYYYANDSTLLYTGTLLIAELDSMATFEILAPKSNRPEQIHTTLEVNQEKNLHGSLLHERYKIKGGFLLEDFILKLDTDDHFSGTGRCIQHCAEGTNEIGIIWHGEKNHAEPN